ncbi:MAG TPA: quinolinate synthase NadA [Tepidisphaeraceae bacterium]|jgi:quinolinate synthase|nr:quinolinate synthase NadA [Tepidisphaeraceae bacterium]
MTQAAFVKIMGTIWQQPLPNQYKTLSDVDLRLRIQKAKDRLGSRLLILGHHYQQDAVIEFADFTGDSFELSRNAARQKEAEFVVFCGVHFMAESADVLTADSVKVILPDLGAGCSMADMANLDQTLDCWQQLEETCSGQTIVPVTYMNSSAAIKGFVGEHGGAVCTSSNCRNVLQWALQGGAVGRKTEKVKVLFFPDQHLGRNTAYAMGHPLDSMVLWNPREDFGGNDPQTLHHADFVLWKGHCSVHQLFRSEHVDQVRVKYPDMKVIVHPECQWEVVQKSDSAGSTAYIVEQINAAPPGSQWAVGTEVHLVNRLAHEHPEQKIIVLSDCQCLCTTMYRIDLPHLCWVLENLVEGNVVNQIKVDAETRKWAVVALDRMLAIRGTGNPIGKNQPAGTTVD